MNALLECLSHSPLKGCYDPVSQIVQETEQVIQIMGDEIRNFDPELIFLFAPDHYNGFFLDMMPQICIGMAADSVGDYGGEVGALNVPRGIAEKCANHVVDAGFDLAFSYRMQVDHGFEQPLMELTGGLRSYPVIPLFINSVAPPVISFKRARQFGAAVGEFARTLGKRVLFVGSGGISHNPPVPQIATALPEVAERIIAGRNPSEEARDARQKRTIDAAVRFAAGEKGLCPLNPEWDQQFMANLANKEWAALDAYTNESITRDGGASAHEVKTWVAANAAMNAMCDGNYEPQIRYYQAIPEWISGFGAMSAQGRR